jgi:hypothetical protein
MGLFQNILLGGVVSDVIQMAAVRRSIEQVRALAGQVRRECVRGFVRLPQVLPVAWQALAGTGAG